MSLPCVHEDSFHAEVVSCQKSKTTYGTYRVICDCRLDFRIKFAEHFSEKLGRHRILQLLILRNLKKRIRNTKKMFPHY